LKPTRSILLLVSIAVAVFLLGGGLAMKVGAGDNTYRQVVVFSEVLSLVLDNYVDPVDPQVLLDGAYEGMLGGLDAHGAYLRPEEVRAWKEYRATGGADPGIVVLKAGRALQIVAIDPGSPAEEAGLEVGDHVRSVDGQTVRELSLDQAWRLILGPPGSRLKLDVLHPEDGFRREEVDLERVARRGRPYELSVRKGIALLEIRDLARVDPQALGEELDDVLSRGVTRLLIDVRNVASSNPRLAAPTAGLFTRGAILALRKRDGSVTETVEAEGGRDAWPGPVDVLVNGATAGAGEALASVIRFERGGLVLGETTYGLGSEPKLYELEDGSGLLVSAALWETPSGGRWNGDGLAPDESISGRGEDWDERVSDQLERALQFLEQRADHPEPAREAA
jgi:carboxyl-terminal processing protease